MPRPERPIDGSTGPAQLFAAELRKLRDAAGGESYRSMAARVHLSKATPSSAASGHRLPTWDVTKAYVQACGGEVDEWRRRWVQARADLGLPPDEPAPAAPREPERAAGKAGAGPAIAAVVAVLVAAAFGTARWWGANRTPPETSPPSADTTPRFAGTAAPVADGADPKESGCAYDPEVTTLDSVEINTAQRNFLGTAELRYSPRCRVAWGRFTPSDRVTFLRSATVTIAAARPRTTTKGLPYSTEFDGQAVFGNILLTADGCVQVTVTVAAPSGGGTSTTGCRPT